MWCSHQTLSWFNTCIAISNSESKQSLKLWENAARRVGEHNHTLLQERSQRAVWVHPQLRSHIHWSSTWLFKYSEVRRTKFLMWVHKIRFNIGKQSNLLYSYIKFFICDFVKLLLRGCWSLFKFKLTFWVNVD